MGLSILPSSSRAKTVEHLRSMMTELPRRVRVWIGGGGARGLELGADAVSVVITWAELDVAIAALRA